MSPSRTAFLNGRDPLAWHKIKLLGCDVLAEGKSQSKMSGCALSGPPCLLPGGHWSKTIACPLLVLEDALQRSHSRRCSSDKVTFQWERHPPSALSTCLQTASTWLLKVGQEGCRTEMGGLQLRGLKRTATAPHPLPALAPVPLPHHLG